MESFYWTKFNLKFWLIRVATFCRYNSRTYSWHSFPNGNQILFGKFFPTLLQKFPQMCCTCRLLCFHPSVQFIPNQLEGGLSLVTVLAIPWFVAYRFVLFFWGSSDIAWRYVLSRYLAAGWTPDQLGVDERVLHGAAKCCGRPFGSGCQSLCASRRLWIQQKSPRSSRFHLHVWQLVSNWGTILSPTRRRTKPCVINRRFQILIHRSIRSSSSFQ